VTTFVPSSERIPGTYQRVELVRSAGLSSLPLKIALVAYRAATADDSRDEVVQRLFSREDATRYYEPGSILDLMSREAFSANAIARADANPGGAPEVYAVAVPPPAGGGDLQAVYTITFAGAGTGQGFVIVEVCDQAVSIPVNNLDTPTTIATRAIEALALLEPDLPATSASALGVVTTTAREKGEHGNDIFITADVTNAPGITVTVAQTVVGVGVVSLVNALDQTLGIDLLDAVVVCQDDAQTITDLSVHVENAWQYDTDRPVLGVMGSTGDLSLATATAAALDRYRIQVTNAEKIVGVGAPWDAANSSRSMAAMIAAGSAARLYSQEKPNYNYARARLPGRGRPGTLDRTVANAAIAAGVCVIVDDGQGARYLDPVTTAITDQTGQTIAPDIRWQPVEIVRTVQAVWNQARVILDRFASADQTQETLDSAKTSTLSMLRNAALARWIATPDDTDVATSFADLGGTIRLVVDVEYRVLVGVRIVEVTHRVSR